MLIIDEANKLMSWGDKHPEKLRSLLDFFVQITKQKGLCHVVMATSEFGFQTWLNKGVCAVKSACLHGCLLVYPPASCLPACLPACLLTCLRSACSPVYCVPACLPACLPAHLPAFCLPAHLPAVCLPACLPACLQSACLRCLPAYLPAVCVPAHLLAVCLPTCLPASLWQNTLVCPTYMALNCPLIGR